MKVGKIESFAAMFQSLAADKGRGAGFVFVCTDDNTILLAHRSKYVDQPGVWTGLGGHVEKGESPKEAAKREVKEEAGSMPHYDDILAVLEYNRNGMHYTTYVANLSKKEKERWKPVHDHENDKIEWFHKMPKPLHPGFAAALKDYIKDSA